MGSSNSAGTLSTQLQPGLVVQKNSTLITDTFQRNPLNTNRSLQMCPHSKRNHCCASNTSSDSSCRRCLCKSGHRCSFSDIQEDSSLQQNHHWKAHLACSNSCSCGRCTLVASDRNQTGQPRHLRHMSTYTPWCEPNICSGCSCRQCRCKKSNNRTGGCRNPQALFL